MSRRVQVPVDVRRDPAGTPFLFIFASQSIPVIGVISHWREWIGFLDAEPERDIWQVETPLGACELHYLSHPAGEDAPDNGTWLLWRWED